jgi:NDP-sugar pyrophosphorylase family protein
MRYAIIAAGEGSRLLQEGIGVPKPLVRIGEERLIDRLVRIFVANNATQIAVICRPATAYSQTGEEKSPSVCDYLYSLQQQINIPLHVISKVTPSSMHSMFELSGLLNDEPFVLTTVDTVFREREFADYVNAFSHLLEMDEADGLMGVTDYIDDEKPLYVEAADDMRITAFLDSCQNPRFISGGIYGLTPRSLQTLQHCMERGESRMRNFQRALITDGLRLKAYAFSKVLDIDHVSDILKAEQFLR